METEVPETAFRHDLANFLEELLLKIFSYLRIDDLCRAGGACSRWYRLTRPLWEIVDCRHLKLTSERIEKLFSILPSHTKHLRIFSSKSDHQTPDFRWLKQRCPELETLHLKSVYMTENVTLEDLPLKVKVLSFENCFVLARLFFRSHSHTAQIEVLNITSCMRFTNIHLSQFSKIALPYLQELYLSGCVISDEWVYNMAHEIPLLKVLDLEHTLFEGSSLELLSESCKFLEELFLGETLVDDEKLSAIKASAFPKLRVLCLRGTQTTLVGRLSVLLALPDLQYLNGCPREDASKNITANDFLMGFCDHFFWKYKGFSKKDLHMCTRFQKNTAAYPCAVVN